MAPVVVVLVISQAAPAVSEAEDSVVLAVEALVAAVPAEAGKTS